MYENDHIIDRLINDDLRLNLDAYTGTQVFDEDLAEEMAYAEAPYRDQISDLHRHGATSSIAVLEFAGNLSYYSHIEDAAVTMENSLLRAANAASTKVRFAHDNRQLIGFILPRFEALTGRTADNFEQMDLGSQVYNIRHAALAAQAIYRIASIMGSPLKELEHYEIDGLRTVIEDYRHQKTKLPR